MYNHNYKKPCGCTDKKSPCGCEEPQICGCPIKHDLMCSFYSGVVLNPIGIEPGMDGNTIIRMLVRYFEEEIADIQIDPTVIKSIGGKIDIYKGLADTFIHEIKSIQGENGVIVENNQASPNNCDNPGDYINVRIDEVWLRNWMLDNICSIITEAGCIVQPPQDPTVNNVLFNLGNRATKIFTLSDFTSHYSDPQSSPLTSIKLTGNVLGYQLNNVNYIVNTEISVSDLNSGAFKYIGNNVDNQYTYTTPYQAKNSTNNWSNTANIIASVDAKIFVQLSPVTVSLIREVTNNKTSTVSYTNGTGQTLTTGQVLYTTGVFGQPGYLNITVQTGTILNGSGSFVIVVSSIPSSNQSNQTVNYSIDGSTGVVNLTYNSNPTTSNIVIDLSNRGTHGFTTAEFIASYFDYDGNTLSEIRATSNVIGYEYDINGTNNWVSYVANTWIPVNNITRLRYVALNQNAAYTYTTPWQAKDSQGNIST